MASFAALPALAPFPRLASRVPGKLAGRALRARAQVPRNCRADSPFVRVRASASADPGDAARLINRVPKPRRGFATATAAFALTVALAVFPAEQADAKLVNIQIDPATLTTRACDDPRAGGVPGSATYKAKCMEIVGVATNASSETVYNADVYGSIKDSANDDVLNSGRVGSIPTLKPGPNEFRLQLTVATSQPLPLKLKSFKASGTTQQLNASPNPYDDYTEFDDFGAQK